MVILPTSAESIGAMHRSKLALEGAKTTFAKVLSLILHAMERLRTGLEDFSVIERNSQEGIREACCYDSMTINFAMI